MKNQMSTSRLQHTQHLKYLKCLQLSGIAMCIALLSSMFSNFAHAQYAQSDAKSKGDAGSSIPKEIIKSVDARGRISYSDRQILGNRQVQVMRASAFERVDAPAASKGSLAAVDASVKPPGAADPTNQGNQANQANKAVAEANLLIAKSNCQNAKMSLASLASGPRLVRMSPEGERVLMTEDQIESDRAKATDVIAKNCS